MNDLAEPILIIGIFLAVITLGLAIRLFRLENKVRGAKPQHTGHGIISPTQAVDTARQLQHSADRLTAARATINRVEALYDKAAPFPHISTTALREALDNKTPTRTIRRDPQSGLIMTREEYQATYGFPAKAKLQSPNTDRAAAGLPDAPGITWARDLEQTRHSLEQTRHDLTTTNARLSNVKELYQDWARYGEGAISYHDAAARLLEAMNIGTRNKP